MEKVKGNLQNLIIGALVGALLTGAGYQVVAFGDYVTRSELDTRLDKIATLIEKNTDTITKFSTEVSKLTGYLEGKKEQK